MFTLAKMIVDSTCLCGIGKTKGASFCYHCYHSLPGKMKRGLYRRFGQGYERAFLRATLELTRIKKISINTDRYSEFMLELDNAMHKHRDKVVITCEEECWCWKADLLLSQYHEEKYQKHG